MSPRIAPMNRILPGREALLEQSPSCKSVDFLTELDPKSMVVEDPIVGEELVTLDEHGPGAIQPKAIPAPR